MADTRNPLGFIDKILSDVDGMTDEQKAEAERIGMRQLGGFLGRPCPAWADGQHLFELCYRWTNFDGSAFETRAEYPKPMEFQTAGPGLKFKLCACGARVERTKGGG